MKITGQHYAHIRDTIGAAFTPEKTRAHRAALHDSGKAMDVEKRLRWDLAYAAKLSAWFCAEVYPYANDDHIDTALKAVVKELKL